MYGGTFSLALLTSAPTELDSWLTAINNARVLIAVWLLGLFVYIGVIVLRRKQRLDAELHDIADAQPSVTVSDDGQTITVYAKKSGVAFYILQITISVGVFIALSVGLWYDPRFQRGVAEVVILDLLLGTALLIDATRILFGAVRFFSNAPILIVNAEGITDNATFIATGMGLIPWREISEVFIYNRGLSLPILPSRRLTVVAKNKTIVRQQALWKRALHVFVPSPSDVVRIPEFLVPMPLEELRGQIEAYLQAHGHTLPLSRVPAGADTPMSAG